jgi:hypothetical protein
MTSPLTSAAQSHTDTQLDEHKTATSTGTIKSIRSRSTVITSATSKLIGQRYESQTIVIYLFLAARTVAKNLSAPEQNVAAGASSVS